MDDQQAVWHAFLGVLQQHEETMLVCGPQEPSGASAGTTVDKSIEIDSESDDEDVLNAPKAVKRSESDEVEADRVLFASSVISRMWETAAAVQTQKKKSAKH